LKPDPPRLQVPARAVRYAIRALERGQDERSLERTLRDLGLSRNAALRAISHAKKPVR
jgi:hypothetical protein